MTREIWKYELRIQADLQQIKMPQGAKLLTVQMQNGSPHVWAEVDPELPRERRSFVMFGTGCTMPAGMGYSDVYLGTVQQHGMVWHFYEYTGA